MWIVFLLAALLMLVGGVGGSIVLEKELMAVPPVIANNLEFIKNLVATGGLSICLLGMALCYRKLRWVGRRRGGSGSGRSGRTRAIEPPRKRKQDALPDLGPEGDEVPQSEQPTLLFPGSGDGDDEPGTRKMRRIGRR